MLLQESNCGEEDLLSLSTPAHTLKEQTKLTSWGFPNQARKQKFRHVQLNFWRTSNFHFCEAIQSCATLTLCQQGGLVSRNTVLQMEEQGSRHHVSKQQLCFSVHEKDSEFSASMELEKWNKRFPMGFMISNMIKALFVVLGKTELLYIPDRLKLFWGGFKLGKIFSHASRFNCEHKTWTQTNV